MTNLGSVLKSRDITLQTKVLIVKAMVFPAVMYGCESCIIKKTRRRRTDAFKLWCWRRLLGVPWTARRSNQSIQKEIIPEYSLEGLKLRLQYLGHLKQRADSLEKTLMLGKIEGKRSEQQRVKLLDSITDSMDMNLTKLQKIVEDREDWGAAVHRVTKSWTRLSDSTATTICVYACQERKTRGTSVSTRMSGKGPEMPEALSSHSGSVLVKCLKGRKLPCTMSYKCLYAHLPAYTVSPPSSSHGWRNSNTEWSAAVILKLDCAFQSHLKTLLRCMFWFQGAGVEPRYSACLTSSQVM